MQKRGELTSSQIITLVIAIAGFVIVLTVLLVFLDIDSQTDEEICKLSVLTRATAPDAAQAKVPLQCTTKKICLSTKRGDKCPEQYAGEKNIVSVQISTDPTTGAKQIAETTANAMLDCWNMMGQGKLDLFGGGKDSGILATLTTATNLKVAKSTCIICTRVAVSKEVSPNIIEEVDINKYIETARPDPKSSKTYLNILTDDQVQAFPKKFEDSFQQDTEATNEIALIFMQIITEETPFEAGTTTATYTGAFIFAGSSGLGPLGKLLTLKGTVLGAVAGAAVTGGVAAYQSHQSRLVSAGYCGEFTTEREEEKDGCSILTGMDYHQIEKINDFCSRVEGNP